MDRPVAFKVLGSWLASDTTFVERFRREALAAARISHPNLVAVYDAGSEDDVHYIVMEHVAGETLADTLRSAGRIDPERAAKITTDVADALAAAHAARMIHRDVKPANVMLTPDGRTKLMDLGIARSLDGESITRASSILGTAGYVSPEQARGERVDHRSDIYSLGCVLYEMLTGRQPFVADDPLAVAYKHVHEAVVPPSSLEPSVPSVLEGVTMRAMAKDPAARFQSVAEMVSATDDRPAPFAPVAVTTPLPGIGATTPLPAATETEILPRRIDRPPPRRRMLPLLLALAGLALLAGLAFALLGGDPPDDLGARPSRSPSAAPPRSLSPSRSPSPSEPPANPVQGAVASLQALVNEGVADGTISEKAAEEIQKGLDEALEKYADGDTEKAIDELDHLRDEVDELVDHDEIAHSEEQALRKAIEDLAALMFAAAEED